MSAVKPDRWVLVPVEPTREMALAGEEAHEAQADRGSLWQIKYGWDAMLAAAPSQEAIVEAIAYRLQSIMAERLSVDGDGDIIGTGKASFEMARALFEQAGMLSKNSATVETPDSLSP